MFENLVLFTQRLIRELEMTKKMLNQMYEGKIKKTDLSKEVNEVLIRAKDLKSKFQKGVIHIKHIKRCLRDIKSLRKYVKDVLQENINKERRDKIINFVDQIEKKIILIRDAALSADKENKPIKEELVYA